MKKMTFAVLIMLLSLISCTLADARCKMMTVDDHGDAVYSCVRATLIDVNNIPNEAEWIRFTVSKLSHLPERAFARFALRGLSFYNCELEQINPNVFDGLEKLQQLTFYGSNIHVVESSWFKDLSSLTHLFLDQNDMVYIEPNVFSLIPNLEYLNIEDNNLNCLTKHTLIPLRKLKHVRIDKNPWLCTCYAELVGWMKSRQIDYGVQNTTETRLECMVEYGTQTGDLKTDLDTIHENSSDSRTEYLSISPMGYVSCVGNNISVFSQIPDNVRAIKFLNSKLPEIPRFAFFRFGNSLRSLDLSNCSVSDIHPEAFAGLSKLEQLILFNNSVSMVRAEWFRDLRGLKHLTMDSNGIELIQSSVFPLLDKVETLSLKKNDIGCFPMRAFASMKHLRDMSIANNTWICSCLRDFRKWMNQSEPEYPILPTQCTETKMHMSGRQYISGYRNVTFQQDFENEESKIINDNARLALGGTLQGIEPYDSTPIEIATHENHGMKTTQEEAHHKRNKEIANYEYHRLRVNQKQKQQGNVLVMRAKYDGFEKTAVPNIPTEYTNFYIHHNHLARNTKITTVKNSSVEPSLPGTNKSYISVGGTIWDIATISSTADAIRFERSTVPKIISEIFVRHFTLRVLEFLNCGVRDIEPQAFKGMVNLRELILDDNEISVVRSAWFDGTPNLERLSLLRNSITRIEHGVFRLLLNLKYFGISNNQLNCIGIEGLSHLKILYSMDVGNNPWSCLCQTKLHQWLIEHKIRYDTDNFDRRADWDCIEEHQGLEMANINYQTRNSVENARFDRDSEVEESAIIRAVKNAQNTKKIHETKDIMEDSEMTQTEDNTNFNVTVTGVQQTVSTPTTVEPEYPMGQCRFHEFNQSKESRWWCNGVDILALDQIPSNAESIEITNSNMSIVPANIFVRFSNLTRLYFYNSSIRDIDPLAFDTLNKLTSLIFVDNSIPTVRSSWFHGLFNVTVLGLVRNGITEIEPDVFEYLPNLERFFINDNNLRCIYTKSLSSLKYLQKVRMQDNPWKWRCQAELTQFFESRNISYVNSEGYDEKRFIADLLPKDNSE